MAKALSKFPSHGDIFWQYSKRFPHGIDIKQTWKGSNQQFAALAGGLCFSSQEDLKEFILDRVQKGKFK